MTVWIVLMNHAFVRPTALTSYPLRAKGYWQFTVIYLCLCLFSIFVGFANVFFVYAAFTKIPRRIKKFKSATLIGSYGLIASVAFRDFFAKHAYEHVCDGYRLMAEIYVQPDFPHYDGTPGSAIYDASSSIHFYKEGEYRYTMDLIRAWNQSLGFDNIDEYNRKLDDKSWGSFSLALRALDTEKDGNKSVEYFNATKMVEDQSKGVYNITAPGPIANIYYSLHNLTYSMTFTNTTAPGHPPTKSSGGFAPHTMGLSFPRLRLEQSQSREWRFTDHVCLPPRVRLRGKYHVSDDVYGDLSFDVDGQDWWQWVESVWPVATGIVAWEFENFEKCCQRRD
ncbi:hypothetical protein K440DRAFT_637942 [Wilcoxina mikolae CBS 423.85]|nr:hypothetical protein K440DRAFT_637942 [Wilcoxina mikolae CBS 423.85]